MAKSVKSSSAPASIITNKSWDFLKKYIDNASPVGFESSGQKLWLDYLTPYVDTFFTDAYGTAVGVINGLIISKLNVNPLIATLGVGLILQGLLSASFTNFAGSVPPGFQAFAYGALGPMPYSVIGLFVLALLMFGAWPR